MDPTIDEYADAVERVAGLVHECEDQPDINTVRDLLICSECIDGRGGSSNIIKWSIPHFFPHFGFTDMRRHKRDAVGRDNWTSRCRTEHWISRACNDVWEFVFRIDFNSPMQEFDITLLYARRASEQEFMQEDSS